MIKKFLDIVREKAGAIHWWNNKITSIILIPIILYFFIDLVFFVSNQQDMTIMLFIHALFDYSPYILLITNIVLLTHICVGIEAVLEDYVHDEELLTISIILTRISMIQIAKSLYLYTILF